METYINHVKHSFTNAEQGISKVNQEILDIDGMSGQKTRHLYNNLLTMDDARYLEIGVWKGSSTCAAMYGNKATVVCIDNFSQFNDGNYGKGGFPRPIFLHNFDKFRGVNNATFIDADCFLINPVNLPKFNIYLYDGDHTEESQCRALTHFFNNLDDTFIFIVDDWNWTKVRDGTYSAIKKLNLKILFEKETFTTDDNSHPEWGSPRQVEWHNGVYVAVLQKA